MVDRFEIKCGLKLVLHIYTINSLKMAAIKLHFLEIIRVLNTSILFNQFNG